MNLNDTDFELFGVPATFAQERPALDARFKTYGCGSAIASSSLVTEWVKGKTLDEAAALKNAQIAEELALPPVKIHCSILAEDAIKAAVLDYKQKHVATTGASAAPALAEETAVH